MEELKDGQKKTQILLESIKQLLTTRQQAAQPSAPPPFRPVDISVAGAPYRGGKNAKVTMIEFTDYQCPFCSRHAKLTLPQIAKEYIDSGKVKYVLRDFPLESIHPAAFKAAEAAHCAGDQGKYWEMHERFFNQPGTLAPEGLVLHAEGLGLDKEAFQKCLDSGKHSTRVRQSLEDGQKAGVQGTPATFVGLTGADGKTIKTVKFLNGAHAYGNFKQAIDALLTPPGESAKK